MLVTIGTNEGLSASEFNKDGQPIPCQVRPSNKISTPLLVISSVYYLYLS